MAHQLAPDLLQELFALRDRIAAAPHGSATELVHRFASLIGKNPSTVYTWLRNYAGYRTGRKARRRGHHGAAQGNAALHRGGQARRHPWQRQGHTAHGGGHEHRAHQRHRRDRLRRPRQRAAARRPHGCQGAGRRAQPHHPAQPASQPPAPDRPLALPHLLHAEGQAIMRDEEFYKNKPASMDKVRLRCGATSATTTPAAPSTCATSRPLARTSTACSSSCSTPGASNPAACRTACPRCSCGTRAAPTPASPSRTCSTPWALITKRTPPATPGARAASSRATTWWKPTSSLAYDSSRWRASSSSTPRRLDGCATSTPTPSRRSIAAWYAPAASRWCATTSGSSSCATPAHWCRCRRARCASGSWRARN